MLKIIYKIFYLKFSHLRAYYRRFMLPKCAIMLASEVGVNLFTKHYKKILRDNNKNKGALQ